MSTLAILADTRGKAQCRSCGAAIEWATLATSGKKMPFNDPIVVERTELQAGRSVAFVDTTKSLSHFATCPDRREWRRETQQPRLSHHGEPRTHGRRR